MEQSDLDLLQTVPPYHLQGVARTRRLPLAMKGLASLSASTSTLTANEVVEVAPHIFNTASIQEALRSLDDLETTILRELVACGGRANSRDLALYLTSSDGPGTDREASIPPSGMSTIASLGEPAKMLYPTPHPHGPFELALRRLLLLGLIFWGKQTSFAGRDYASGVYDGVLIVPVTVREAVREAWPATEPLQDEGEEIAVGEGIRALQRTLYLYWSLVASMRDGLSLLNSNLLSRPALRQVIDQLQPKSSLEQIRSETDVPRLLFIRLLLMELGLLRVQQGTVRAAPAEAYFALPLLERARRCYRLWLETPFWNEMATLPEVVVRPGPAPLEPAHEEIIQARHTIIERLQHEPVDSWLDVSAFIAHTKLYAPSLLFPRKYGPRAERYSVGSNPYDWDFRLRHGWLTPREGWYMVEGGFIRTLLSGPLSWLGLVDINNDGRRTTFRLLPDTRLITSDTPREVAEMPWGRLIVQPNFDLMAMAPVSETLLAQLDRFAERLRLEHIAHYRLTKQSVTRAIQTGLHAATIQQTLEQAAGSDIPQNVQYSLVEWERQARRVELWPRATLLEVDQPALLDSLYDDEKTRSLLGRRLSPVLAEVMARSLPVLQQALWQRDYLPTLTPAPAHDSLLASSPLATREPQWHLRDDGLLQPLYPVLDLYLATEVERISTLHEETGWRQITPASMQAAREAGIPLDTITRFLQHYCEGGVPASFLIRLKLWGGGYTGQQSISVEPAPLLRLSAQVLQDIQSDEALRPLLGTELPPHSRLVRIPPEHLEQVVELLKERGFEVE
ncbi:MAG TPA: helicase-associated domain-containing protein [Ktedonobacteraceae bacterium]|nr:helicase-associated domain-containing protein [Ktedonobacteraceae bacterium]